MNLKTKNSFCELTNNGIMFNNGEESIEVKFNNPLEIKIVINKLEELLKIYK